MTKINELATVPCNFILTSQTRANKNCGVLVLYHDILLATLTPPGGWPLISRRAALRKRQLETGSVQENKKAETHESAMDDADKGVRKDRV